MKKLLLICLFALLVAAGGSAAELAFPPSALSDDAALDRFMPVLASQALEIQPETDRRSLLTRAFRLQMVADRHREALDSLEELIALREKQAAGSGLPLLPYKILARAELAAASSGASLEEAFEEAFLAVFAGLEDLEAVDAAFWFSVYLEGARADLRAALDRQRGKETIGLEKAEDLVRKYLFSRSYELIQPLAPDLIEKDAGRRYLTDDDILVTTPDGAQIAVTVVRPRGAEARLPTLLVFTIYADEQISLAEARRSAAHGYAGAVAYTRGKGRSPGEPVPYEHDGRDAVAVIRWLAGQSWSDGRVGMYGGSYAGFTQWAAAKHRPAALKTIVPWAANNPGNGLPMENNVFLSVNYAWAFYVTGNKGLDNETYSDRERWARMHDAWYASGRPYREIDAVDGKPNPWLQRWLEHPDYDAYWQAMVPHGREYAEIDIPVLTVTGYYDDGQGSALDFMRRHLAHNEDAEHYLVIGPYEHFGAQAPRKPRMVFGYAIDPSAQFDTRELTYQWMDHVFRGAPRPALLQDKVNYQVMGADRWRHAPSLEAMADDTLNFYLSAAKVDLGDAGMLGFRRLSPHAPSVEAFLPQTVDFADRETFSMDTYPKPIVRPLPEASSGLWFVSEPLAQPLEISGSFRGVLEARIDKRDMDFALVLYELLPSGELFQLSYYLGRASYAEDMSVRRLLTPGEVTSIPFTRSRLVAKRLEKGSRLVVALDVNKEAYAQINYGTGKDVSVEDIRDAATPLHVEWRTDSSVSIPVRRVSRPGG